MANIYEQDWGGKRLAVETGKLAGQAGGAVTVHYGDTVVLVTACIGKEPRDSDFLPLTVDYEERLYAAGKIPGGFFRREGRPGQEAILTSRLCDRSIRPLFDKSIRHEIQVMITVLSADLENEPDILAIIGASAALGISEIPFKGPIAACRVGYIDGEFVLNPTFTQLAQSKLDLVVSGTRDGVVMLESGSTQIPEETMLSAIKFAQETNQNIIALMEQMARELGKPKLELKAKEPDTGLQSAVLAAVRDAFSDDSAWKDRDSIVAKITQEVRERFGDSHSRQELDSAFDLALKTVVRETILKKGIRPTGRSVAEIRPIMCDVGILPRTHGTGLFTRGQTQVLTIATLGSHGEEQQIDGLTQEETKRFMHHYNFPPFSTGEVKRAGSPGRREIGHGALAERALEAVIPEETEFPYTIRLVSEVLSSNGSTSMAAVCGSTLSLMDAGVPIKAPVAGVAMGLVTGNGEYRVLTDIEGLEDFYGDMDFKVAGTTEGITAIQLDLKLKSVKLDILEEALGEALKARLFILDKMREAISASRPELSKYAPRITKITIDPDKIRNVIGPGGKTIRSIIEETKVTLDVENDGTVLIGSPNEENTKKAIRMIEDLTKDVEVGAVYTGKVTRVTNFGAFVEILPGKEGLVHISELADYRAPSVEDVVKVGDEIMVMVTEIDRMGRINLSRRAVFQKAAPGAPGAHVGVIHRDAGPQGPRPPHPGGDGPRGRPRPGEQHGGPPPRRSAPDSRWVPRREGDDKTGD